MSPRSDEQQPVVRRPRRRLYRDPDESPVSAEAKPTKQRSRRSAVQATAPPDSPAPELTTAALSAAPEPHAPSQDEREQAARQAIEGQVFNAVALAAVPIPLFDTLAVTLVQVRLVEKLCLIYDQPYSKTRIKGWLAALTGGVLAVKTGLSVFKGLARILPGPGMLLGLASIPAFSAAATHAVGVIFMDHFRSGGTSLTFDPGKARAHFKAQLSKGKDMALPAPSSWKTGKTKP